MIKDTKLRGIVKQYLIGLNIALGLVLFSLIVYWFASVRPTQIEKAIQLGQYRLYGMNNLPNGDNEIKPDYIGLQKAVADTMEEIDEVEKELASIDSTPTAIDFNNSNDLIASTNKLLEKTNQLLTNQVSAKSERARKKRQYTGQPKISVIVTTLGLNRRSTELALTLPKECALGFLPYTKSLKPLLHRAQGNGHEIYLYLPLQTSKSYDNPGRYALMSNLAQEENSLRLNVILNSHARYDGVYSSYKEVFTDNERASDMVLDHLDDKNLIFLLGKGLRHPVPGHIKSHNNILPTNIIIDEEPDNESISSQLEELIRVAEEDGIALGYAQGFTLTIEMLRDWAPKLKKKGIKLVPVSHLLKEYNS
jgi:polysaccharide deacetylase 2 family uncharacterized protein YibQ